MLNFEDEAQDDKVIQKIHIRQKELFTNITSRFHSLWIISFAYCDPLPSITPLSHFKALGFLDLSYTKVTFKEIQKGLKRTHLLRLNCFGCKMIQSVHGPASNRGFLLFVVPHVWVLDGVFVTYVERQKWRKFFTADTQGIYSSLFRKWKLEEEPAFVPTYLNPTYDDSPSDTHFKIIYTKEAHDWIGNLPGSFTMAVEYDMWKLDKLALAFEDYIADGFIDRIMKTLICGSVVQFTSCRNDVTMEQPIESKCIFAILLFGSLFLDFPPELIHTTMYTLFDERKGEDNWTSIETSPATWSFKDRLTFLGLLLGRLLIDVTSAVHESSSKFRIGKETIESMQRMISFMMLGIYPPSLDQVQDEFDYDSCLTPTNIAGSHAFLSKISKDEIVALAIIRLQLLELICVPSFNVLFLKHFVKLHGIFTTSINILLAPAVDSKESLRLLDWNAQDLSDLASWRGEEHGMSLQAKVAELKLRLNMMIQIVFRQLVSQNEVECDDDFIFDSITLSA